MTDDTPSLAVTGATGVLGGLVARTLADLGIAQRLLVRTVAKAPALARAVVFPFSYADRAASERALAGVETLFMVSASESVDRVRQHCAFVDSARAAGVKHIVYTSFIGASPASTFTLARDHYATEAHIRATGIDHTFLRDSIYTDFMQAMVGDDGAIRGPAGDGRVAIVARRDIARTAASVLQNAAAHVNATYDLTGPEAVTMTDVAATLSRCTGRPVTFYDETIPEAYESRKKWNAPDWQTEAWVSTYAAIATGELSIVSGTVLAITGRPPMSLAQFLASEGMQSDGVTR